MLVHQRQALLHFDATIDSFIRVVYNVPTLSETYKHAAYDGRVTADTAIATVTPTRAPGGTACSIARSRSS